MVLEDETRCQDLLVDKDKDYSCACNGETVSDEIDAIVDRGNEDECKTIGADEKDYIQTFGEKRSRTSSSNDSISSGDDEKEDTTAEEEDVQNISDKGTLAEENIENVGEKGSAIEENDTSPQNDDSLDNSNMNSETEYHDLNYYRYFKLSLAVICILTFLTRVYKIDEPSHICWDETHFGKFANHYLNGTFFFDVHPPLGKMLLALAGYVTGYNGTFPFDKPGDKYGEHDYVGMRMFCATLGGACVPLSFLTVWELTRSLPACILSASFILFDTGCVTISQYILLDPILMFFMMLSIYSVVKFYTWQHAPFSFDWWGWMLCTGYFLACTFSVKWVGLFVILFVGVSTVKDLWDLIGDLSNSLAVLVKHFIARVIGLIIVPVMVYLSFFGVHFQYLPYSGPGDGFFSSAFQSTLMYNQLHKAMLPAELAYGAEVTIKNYQSSGTLLHSHASLYPKEHPAEQQQITGYSHKDQNNNWKIHKLDSLTTDSDPLQRVHDGDILRLMHVNTGRNLHSHHERAPMSENLMQVTGYGEQGFGDSNDHWKIQVYKNPGKNGVIQTVKTVFRLIHVNTGCALAETSNVLPEWGFGQREVACNPISHLDGTTWNIEANTHKQIPEVSIELLAPSFLESVYESHIIMAKTNNGFKPKEGEFQSLPWHWPINYRGQVFSGGDYRVYLLGNPVIWWLILATYVVYVFYFFFFEIRSKRGYEMDPGMKEKSELVVRTCAWLLVGWLLHYVPFYLMGRVLYFHHYFPAYLLSAMISGILLEHVILVISLSFSNKFLERIIYYASIGLLLLVAIASFYSFRGLTYGMFGPSANDPNATLAAYKWLDTWEI